MRSIIAAALAATVFAAPALAAPAPAPDPRLDGLKQVERSACVRAGNTGPGAPKNLKLVPKYCECVAAAYWDTLPREEVEELMSSGRSEAMERRKAERMGRARDACQR
ncbi:hypothetical protein [Pseudoduganella namucuonensis]|uniref:Secreted protein n=1 Tax=Pseudoduganella namucuonensis TaxID=1035707 RepID=A0A1I7GGS2_9BURK|nr:hypothetical protein [Pseudoduganella namucuonensis]SFU47692.1 hypothetical protein SAMN05216552_1003312 [Pseudoduganella namucuonensis]